MATKLTKNLVRESSEVIDGKEIMVTMTEDQEIELKLKGKRGRGETIYIKDLYGQLFGVETESEEPKSEKKGSLSITPTKPKRGDNKMISLHDLRSHNAISMLDLPTLAKFDQIIKSVLESTK
jgi:hypothetical protein